MLVVIQWIASFAFLFYILLVIVALVLLRVLSVTLRERARSIFSLEREHATARITRTVNYLLLILLMAFGVFYAQTQLIAQMPSVEFNPTPIQAQLPPTPTSISVVLPSPTPTPSPTAALALTTQLAPTATPTTFVPIQPPTDTPTPESARNGVKPDCPNSGVSISEPGDGAIVSGLISIFGAAYVDNFEYYKIEFRAPGRGDWSFIQRYNSPNYGGPIATWNTATVPSGTYEFRLVVVDKVGNYPPPCRIQLIVQ